MKAEAASVPFSRRVWKLAAIGLGYWIVLVLAGVSANYGIGDGGPTFFLDLAMSPLSAIRPALEKIGFSGIATSFSSGGAYHYMIGVLLIPQVLLWPYVGWLLGRRGRPWRLGIVLAAHYIGVILITVSEGKEFAGYFRAGPGLATVFFLPYVIGQIFLVLYLVIEHGRPQVVA